MNRKGLVIGGIACVVVVCIACVGLAALFWLSGTYMIFTGGVPLGGVQFTDADIGVPEYPGAQPTTEDAVVIIHDDMRRLVGTLRNARWKLYTTDDSRAKVLAWYDQAMQKEGWRKGSPRESGVVIYLGKDPFVALSVVPIGGKTNILLVAGTRAE